MLATEHRFQLFAKRHSPAVGRMADVGRAERRFREPADRDHAPTGGEPPREGNAVLNLTAGGPPVRARGSRMRRHDVPEEDLLLHAKLG